MVRSFRTMIIGPAILLGGIFAASTGYREMTTAAQLKEAGVNAPGEVVGGEARRGRRGSQTHKLKVLYQSKDNGPITKDFTVSKSVYQAAENNSSIEVRYLPSDPNIAEIVGDESTGTGLMAGGGVAAVIGLVVSFFVFFKKQEPTSEPLVTPTIAPPVA